MTIADMHIWFRQYAQQMGMQNVRALLPEQIDLLINTSITDTVNQIIQQNIAVTNDRIITDNSKIGQVNALKTLYKVSNLRLLNAYGYSTTGAGTLVFSFNPSDVHYTMKFTFSPFFEEEKEKEIVIECTATTVDALNSQINAVLSKINIGGYTPIFMASSVTIDTPGGINFKLTTNVPVTVGIKAYSSSYTTVAVSPKVRLFAMTTDDINKGKLSCYGLLSDYLYLVDFSIDYKTADADRALSIGTYDSQRDDVAYTDDFTTTYFPIRLIDDTYLADCLNDFINAPKLRSPIITVNNETFDIYFDKVIAKDGSARLENGLLPYTLRFSYLEKPAKVKKSADLNGVNVDCNLPEYLHVDILKHTVDLYRASINGGMLAQQGQDQNQQREIARNTAVPSNGYNQ